MDNADNFDNNETIQELHHLPDRGVTSSYYLQNSSLDIIREGYDDKDEESFAHSPLVPSPPPHHLTPYLPDYPITYEILCPFNDSVENLLFFGCGLGSSVCYIATLSSLVYFTIVYGPDSYVDLNLAVYLPLLPISLAQARWDQEIDQQLSSRWTYSFRVMVGFGLNLTGTIRMMVHSSRGNGSLGMLILDALFQGIGGAILYGTFNQMASFVGVGDGRRLKAAVSAGVQASALVVLAASLFTRFGISHEEKQFPSFLWIIVIVETVCLLMCLLLLVSPLVVNSMSRRDLSIQPVLLNFITEEGDRMSQNNELEDPLLNANLQISYAEIFENSKHCFFILFVNLVPSFLVGSWFTQIETDWIALAQFLFYVRIGADFLGRLATVVIPPQSIDSLTWIAGLRLLPVVLFFANSRGPLPINCGEYCTDIFSIILVAVIAFFSGYLVTGCYQLAPIGLPSDIRDANLSKQASLLTVAFSFAAVGGLLLSFVLLSFGL